MRFKSEFQHGGYLNEFYRRITKGVSSALAIITLRRVANGDQISGARRCPKMSFRLMTVRSVIGCSRI